MISWFKKWLGKEQAHEEEKPGRTFKRLLTGDYFGLRSPDATPEQIKQAKTDKIETIRRLSLQPVYVRYAVKKNMRTNYKPAVTAAHVVFQKEVLDEKWHMVHVTEVSFIVPVEEFEEFEAMAGVSLAKDFRDLTEYEGGSHYTGKERRKIPRESLLEKVS
jgi:hypothetical protein